MQTTTPTTKATTALWNLTTLDLLASFHNLLARHLTTLHLLAAFHNLLARHPTTLDLTKTPRQRL
jgi:hypothetical protein